MKILDREGADVTPQDARWALGRAHDGGWLLQLHLDDGRLPVPYTIDPSVSGLTVSSTSLAASAVANWTASFTVASSLASGGFIRFQFPSTATLPSSPAVALLGSSGFVSSCVVASVTVESGNTVKTTLGNAPGQTCALSAGNVGSVKVIGVTNPSGTGSKTFSVKTSADTTAASTTATIAATTSPTRASITADDTTAGDTSARWLVDFVTSSTNGGLVAGSTIIATFNSAITVPSTPTVALSSAFAGCSASLSGSGHAITITLADASSAGSCSIPASTEAWGEIHWITNPAAGSYSASTFTVSTSSDATAVASDGGAVSIYQGVSGVSVSFTTSAAGATSTATIGFTTSASGSLHAGSTIQADFPGDTSIVSSPTITLGSGFSGCTASGSAGGSNVIVTLANASGGTCSLPASTSATLTVAGVTNPSSPGSYPSRDFFIVTSADHGNVSPTTPLVFFGTADHLAFSQQPSDSGGGSAFATQPVVSVEDSIGDVVANDNTTTVTLSIGTNPASGTLTCTSNPVTATNGVATFAGCKIDHLGSGYTLTTSNNHSLTNATSNSFNITAGAAASLLIAGSSTQIAGASNSLTITALDAGGNVASSYTGSKNLTFSGAADAPDGTHPTVTDNGGGGGTAINFGTATSITFASGVSSAGGSMKLYKAENATIQVTDGTISNTGLNVTVSPAALDHFTFALASPQTSGTAFTGTNTLTAVDPYLNAEVGFDASSDHVTVTANSPLTGTVSGLHGSNVLNASGDFSSGVANLTTLGMTYTGTATSGTFSATSGTGKSGTSSSISISSWDRTDAARLCHPAGRRPRQSRVHLAAGRERRARRRRHRHDRLNHPGHPDRQPRRSQPKLRHQPGHRDRRGRTLLGLQDRLDRHLHRDRERHQPDQRDLGLVPGRLDADINDALLHGWSADLDGALAGELGRGDRVCREWRRQLRRLRR